MTSTGDSITGLSAKGGGELPLSAVRTETKNLLNESALPGWSRKDVLFFVVVSD